MATRISEPYLNEIEHDLRRPPRAHMVRQFVAAINVSADVLFFLVGRLPDDLHDDDVTHEEVIAALSRSVGAGFRIHLVG
jgi:hypothetical protein